MRKNKARSPTDLDATIGERIKTGRTLRGMSQEHLAAQIGVTFQQLQKYENGTNRVSASRLYGIAKLLGMPLAYFFGGHDIVPKTLGLTFDEDTVDILRKCKRLSLSKRKFVRDFLATLVKGA